MIRTILALTVVFGFTFLVGPPGMLVALFQRNPRVLYTLGRTGCRLGFRLAGIRLVVKGSEWVDPSRTYVFLANHQSNTDPPALLLAIPHDVKLILKKELGRIPVLNWVMRQGGFIFIDRSDRTNAIQGMTRAANQLARGDSFLIFPEGTRSRSGELGKFKKGPFVIALQAKVPILPVTVSGSYDIMPPGRLRIVSGTITVTFHPPVETQDLTLDHRESLMDQIWNAIDSGREPCSLQPDVRKAVTSS
ncbi:MAG: lysophospholipid acyltransferase family protein [Acidobacteriota bacterium]